MQKDRASASQALWENRILTQIIPANRHSWSSYTDRSFVISHFPDSTEPAAHSPPPPHSLIFLSKHPVTFTQIKVEFSLLQTFFPNAIVYYILRSVPTALTSVHLPFIFDRNSSLSSLLFQILLVNQMFNKTSYIFTKNLMTRMPINWCLCICAQIFFLTSPWKHQAYMVII